jgi:GAF domain-containing protein
LSRRQALQSALVDLATAYPVVEGTPETATAQLTETLCETLDVARASVWRLDDETTLRCLDRYDRANDDHDDSDAIVAAHYPRYFEAIRNARAVAATDARRDPRTCEFVDHSLELRGITSMLDAPIRYRGDVVGVVCTEHVGQPRTWTEDEVWFVASVADQARQVLAYLDDPVPPSAHEAVGARVRDARETLRVARADGSPPSAGHLDDLEATLDELASLVKRRQSTE